MAINDPFLDSSPQKSEAGIIDPFAEPPRVPQESSSPSETAKAPPPPKETSFPLPFNEYGIPPEFYSQPGIMRSIGAGMATAIAEPILGAAQFVPGKVGEEATRQAKAIERAYQKEAQLAPIATRVGYLPTTVLPWMVGAGEISAAPALTSTVAKGLLGGAAQGALTPALGRDFWGEKAIDALIGGGLGGALGLASGALSKGINWYRTTSEAAKGLKTEAELTKLASDVERGVFRTEATGTRAAQETEALKALLRDRKISEGKYAEAIKQYEGKFTQAEAQLASEEAKALQEMGQIKQTFDAAPTEDTLGRPMLDRFLKTIKDTIQSGKELITPQYTEWLNSANQQYAKGETFQASQAGKDLADKWAGKMSTTDIQAHSGERALLKRIFPDVIGIPRPGTPAGTLVDELGRPLMPAQPGSMAYAPPKVIWETLKYLRHAARGEEIEGYTAVSKMRAGEMARELADAINEWNPLLRAADEAYVDMLETTRPFRDASLRGEKIDPSSVPKDFFKTPQTVEQAVLLSGGDRAAVENEAANYVFRSLRGKSPEEARKWLESNQVSNWLNKETLPNAYDRVNRAVSQMEEASQKLKQVTEARTVSAKAKETALSDLEQQQKNIRKELRGLEETSRTETASIRQPFNTLMENIKRGHISKQDVPAAVQKILTDQQSNIPREIAQSWQARLDEIQKIQNAEEKAANSLKIGQNILTYLAGGTKAQKATKVLSTLGTPTP
jgi:hypothetical protein